ncbi:MAG TPA: 6-phosphogluconolactonase [Nitrospirota bacterium]|nr:6-phosphogluconolactonase [Nitrospirota bacterium]
MTEKQRLQVRVFKDLEELSRVAAELFTAISKKSIASHGGVVVALSGGSTPHQLYSLLGSPRYRDVIDWSRMHIFWADERCVPKDQLESNYRLAYDAFLSHVPLPAQNIHRIRGEDEPHKAAKAYEDELRNFFSGPGAIVFDLIILGVGEDGHTASLFPGSPALDERMRPAVPVYLQEPKINRVTLTLPVLNHAAQILFLASGRAKAGVVHEIMEDGNPKQYPAGLVRPLQGSIVWMIDHEASSALTKPFPTSVLNERR